MKQKGLLCCKMTAFQNYCYLPRRQIQNLLLLKIIPKNRFHTILDASRKITLTKSAASKIPTNHRPRMNAKSNVQDSLFSLLSDSDFIDLCPYDVRIQFQSSKSRSISQTPRFWFKSSKSQPISQTPCFWFKSSKSRPISQTPCFWFKSSKTRPRSLLRQRLKIQLLYVALYASSITYRLLSSRDMHVIGIIRHIRSLINQTSYSFIQVMIFRIEKFFL